MTTSTLTPRQSFRETVALVAARAKERLPQAVDGRVESAVKLVLVHDVTPQEDGTILVGSSTDPLKTYRLQGPTCECQDFTRGQAPDGWCQHRIAAGIHKRVQEVLEEVEVDTSTSSQLPVEAAPVLWGGRGLKPVDATESTPAPLPEAPASVNVRLTVGGREGAADHA